MFTGYEMVVKRRMAAGNRVNVALIVLIRRRNVSTTASLALYNTVLAPTLLYDNKMWIL